MAKEKKIVIPEDPDIRDFRSDLTRIDPTTKFVIEHKTGRVRFIFKKAGRNGVIKHLLHHKFIDGIHQLRENAYNDLIIMK